MSSSSVAITKAFTGLSGALMHAAPDALAAASKCRPSQLSRSQTAARIGAADSPIPPVKTTPSIPPMALAMAPVSQAIR